MTVESVRRANGRDHLTVLATSHQFTGESDKSERPGKLDALNEHAQLNQCAGDWQTTLNGKLAD